MLYCVVVLFSPGKLFSLNFIFKFNVIPTYRLSNICSVNSVVFRHNLWPNHTSRRAAIRLIFDRFIFLFPNTITYETNTR